MRAVDADDALAAVVHIVALGLLTVVESPNDLMDKPRTARPLGRRPDGHLRAAPVIERAGPVVARRPFEKRAVDAQACDALTKPAG